MADCPKVIAVVPVHNGRDETLAFLDSMSRITWPSLEIIVVDDGSTDGTAEAIAVRFPGTILLHGDGNLWWTGATNFGIREALDRGADFILTVNNDNVVEPGFLEPLVEAVTSFSPSLVTAKMRDYDDRSFICSFGGKLDWHLGEIRDYNSRRDRINYDEPMECDWLHGSCTLIPVRVFAELGLFDQQSYPQYHADTEFSLRAKRRGYRLIAVPQSQVAHRSVISTGTEALNRDRLKHLVGSIRSPFYFKANYRLYRDYCPYRPYLPFLCLRYARLMYSLLRRRFIDRSRDGSRGETR
jgi:GT2 family glycosyltransferase